MASLTITTRQTTSGARYVVRYRLGRRRYPIVHGGSFETMREARARRDLTPGGWVSDGTGEAGGAHDPASQFPSPWVLR
jgi:hypothetical protein